MPAAHQVTASTDGAMLIRTAPRRVDGDWRTVLNVHDSMTGDVVDRRRFGGIVDVLDADGSRAVLGSWTPRQRTLLWDVAADTTRRLIRQTGYIADLRADRLGTFTKDPYLGGCTVLRRLSSPQEVLSTSCDERAAAISPSGRRVATSHMSRTVSDLGTSPCVATPAGSSPTTGWAGGSAASASSRTRPSCSMPPAY